MRRVFKQFPKEKKVAVYETTIPMPSTENSYEVLLEESDDEGTNIVRVGEPSDSNG